MTLIRENIDLKPYNTFGVSAKAAFFAEFHNETELAALCLQNRLLKHRLLILGGGSNILLVDDFQGLVLKNSIKGMDIVHQDGPYVYVRSGGGENWHEFVLYCLRRDFGGLENLSLIPGTVGAAPMQNIGAYGVELKDVFYELTAVDIKNGTVRNFSHRDCQFDYRSSIFKTSLKDQFIITSVTFRLTRKGHLLNLDYGTIRQQLEDHQVAGPTIRDVSNAVVSIRQSKLPDPAEIGNSGSFFKNPVISAQLYETLKNRHPQMPGYETGDSHFKVPAAWLIEQCGWKGHRAGECGVHEKHALVLVNYGGAGGQDIWSLALEIQRSVESAFGILLQPEVNVIY